MTAPFRHVLACLVMISILVQANVTFSDEPVLKVGDDVMLRLVGQMASKWNSRLNAGPQSQTEVPLRGQVTYVGADSISVKAEIGVIGGNTERLIQLQASASPHDACALESQSAEFRRVAGKMKMAGSTVITLKDLEKATIKAWIADEEPIVNPRFPGHVLFAN